MFAGDGVDHGHSVMFQVDRGLSLEGLWCEGVVLSDWIIGDKEIYGFLTYEWDVLEGW